MRPAAASAAAFLLALLGVFGLVGGLLITVGSLMFDVTFAGLLGSMGGLVVVVGVVGVVVGVAQIAVAFGLWRLWASAWTAALGLVVVGAVLALLRLGPQDLGGPFITIALHAAVGVLLLLPTTRAAFGRD